MFPPPWSELRLPALTLLLLLGLLLLGVGPAVAALPDPSVLAEPVAPSFWTRQILWIMAQQRAFHQVLSEALLALQSAGVDAVTVGSLIIGSFLYGVFHAAGPGHGKAVITTYLLTNPERLRRGLILAATAAFVQGLSAIGLVYGLIVLAGWLPRETSTAVTWSERMSYGLVAGLGAYLVLKAATSLRRFWQSRDVNGASGRSPEHPHSHPPGRETGAVESEAGGCGCAHTPSSDQLNATTDFQTGLGVVLSIGLRPCSGAVLVLLLAKALGVGWAGVGATFAMSAGTALSIGILAFLTIRFRHWAEKMARRSLKQWHLVTSFVSLLGGGILLAVGLSLLTRSFAKIPHPLGF